jgi:phosphatidylglycerophosphatase A
VAPGTFGSIAGLALCWAATTAGGRWGIPALAIVATAVGILAADRTARALGAHDPGCVVIDEVAGQALALAFLPWSPAVAIMGFLAFRVFDIIKPPPARQLESLPGGLGIVADDLAAGLYANLAVRLLLAVVPGIVSTP